MLVSFGLLMITIVSLSICVLDICWSYMEWIRPFYLVIEFCPTSVSIFSTESRVLAYKVELTEFVTKRYSEMDLRIYFFNS